MQFFAIFALITFVGMTGSKAVFNEIPQAQQVITIESIPMNSYLDQPKLMQGMIRGLL